jgi:outer membrane protein TolC
MAIHLLSAAALTAALLPALAAPAPLSLEQALALAVERSEAARSARAGVLGASEAARAAAQLPDPALRAGIDNLPITGADRFSTTREAMTMKRIGIAQEWVSADKRAARQAAADAMVGRESAAAGAAAAEVRVQTALAFLDAYFATETLRLAMLAEHHGQEELEAAKGRLAASAGGGQEVLALESALGLAEDDAAELRQQQGAAMVALERWVGVAADELLAPAPLATGAEQAFVERHPLVLGARRELDLARQLAAVAASNRRPNWAWELSYGQRTGYSDLVSFGVNIPLPIAAEQRQDRETSAKLALVDKAEANLAEATRAATAEFRTLAGDAQRLAERVQRVQRAVLTPARQRTAAALAGYRSNQLSLAGLFEVRHLELEAQRKLLALRRDLAKTQAQLAFKPLTDGDTR